MPSRDTKTGKNIKVVIDKLIYRDIDLATMRSREIELCCNRNRCLLNLED